MREHSWGDSGNDGGSHGDRFQNLACEKAVAQGGDGSRGLNVVKDVYAVV